MDDKVGNTPPTSDDERNPRTTTDGTEKDDDYLDQLPTRQAGDIVNLQAETAKLEWVQNSPESPRNWPLWKKWNIIIGLLFYTTIMFISNTGYDSDSAVKKYNANEEESVLGTSMFILGVAMGPMLLAPISEVYGRQSIYPAGILMFALLNIPAALSPTLAGFAISRLLDGCFAGIPVANVGASAADLFDSQHTSWPIMLFSFCAQVGGPCLGPMIGAAVYVRNGSLNWLYWFGLIAGGVNAVWALTFKETLHTKVYEKHTGVKLERPSAVGAVAHELSLAARLLVTEPIIISLAATTSFLFGLIFIYLQGYPDVYGDHFNMTPVASGAMFVFAIGGGLIAVATQPLQNYLYRRSALKSVDGRPIPEARLYTAAFAVWIMLISILWFAFTANDKPGGAQFLVPGFSGLFFGYAETAIYTGIWQYATDAYGENSGSALAAINLPANSVAAGLTHASLPFFANVGNEWAIGIIGLISIIYLFVFPILIWKGQWLRHRSPFATSIEQEEQEFRAHSVHE